jgi:hypothetical protein
MSPLALVQMLAMAAMFGEVTGLMNAWDSLPINLCAAMILGTAVMVRLLAHHGIACTLTGWLRVGFLPQRRQLQPEQDHLPCDCVRRWFLQGKSFRTCRWGLEVLTTVLIASYRKRSPSASRLWCSRTRPHH